MLHATAALRQPASARFFAWEGNQVQNAERRMVSGSDDGRVRTGEESRYALDWALPAARAVSAPLTIRAQLGVQIALHGADLCALKHS